MSEQDNLCETCLWWDRINLRCRDNYPREGRCWTNPFNPNERKSIFDQTGINSKFKGIPVILEENGDLIFRCESIDRARALAREMLNKLCLEDI